MANLSLPTAESEQRTAHRVRTARDRAATTVVVAGFDDAIAADCAAQFVADMAIDLAHDEVRLPASDFDMILFLPRRLDARTRAPLMQLIASARTRARFIAVVSTFRVHLGDEAAAAVETYVHEQLRGFRARVVTFRPGHVLSARSTASVNLRRFGFLVPLVPARTRSCCVDAHELFAAIDHAREGNTSRRTYTLLGPNRPWRDLLGERRVGGITNAVLSAVCVALSFLLIGQLAAIALDLLARWFPSLRHWNVDTLKPRSFQELLALYNPHNFQHVKIVGYNNGVNHFGHCYPGKTVVSTVLCNRIVRTGPREIKTDCGATIHKAVEFLAGAEQELFVLPNYSYVSLGTAFFVPIHGSASDYATVAETITRVLLYDPVSDRLIRATSDDPEFRDNVYNMASSVLVLRLSLRVKAKARYFVQRQKLENTNAQQLLTALGDTEAANVEIRKSQASSLTVEVSKYYQATDLTDNLLEFPRDSLGRLWDRLEQNALTSFLMHALTRWFAWHVELFFTADEFARFWETHQTLPLKKIQFRYIRRDGLPHSPFKEHDCISVDLFMFRWHRQAFEAYVKQTFGVVRSNPGKHSQ